MTDRDEMVRVAAEALRPELYAPNVSVPAVSICFGQTFEEALAGARAAVEHQATVVVDALAALTERSTDARTETPDESEDR